MTRTPLPAHLRLPATLLVLALAAVAAWLLLRGQPALTSQAAPLSLRGGRVVAVPPSIRETSLFGTLHNAGPRVLRLTSVQTDAAGHAMLMVTRTDERGLTGMQHTDALTVPAGGDLTLSESGDHIMLMGLRAPLREGQTLAVTLTDDAGQTHSLQVPVVKP